MIYDIKNIAQIEGEAIWDIYKKNFDIEYKNDISPLTTADKVSNTIIYK